MRSSILNGLLSLVSTMTLSGAVVLGPGSSSTVTQHEYQADYAAWFVADLSDPVTPQPWEVTTQVTAGSWLQQLTFAPGAPVLQTGDTFQYQALVQYGGGEFPLNQWSQQITSADWQWTDGIIFNNATAEALNGLQITLAGNQIGFGFEPIAPGSDLFFVSTLKYVGPSGVSPTSLNVQVDSVPEPSTVALASVATLGFAWLMRLRGGGKRGGEPLRGVAPRLGTPETKNL